MATWQYQCVSCGGLHDAPLRPGGAVYLRCIATREWAWHEPSSFISVGAATAPLGGRAEKPRAARSRATPQRRASAARALRRKAGARKVTRHRPASRRTGRGRRGAR